MSSADNWSWHLQNFSHTKFNVFQLDNNFSPLDSLSWSYETDKTRENSVMNFLLFQPHPHSIFLISQEIQHPIHTLKSYTPCVLVYIRIYICVYIPMFFKNYMYCVKPTPFSKQYVYISTHMHVCIDIPVYIWVYIPFLEKNFS